MLRDALTSAPLWLLLAVVACLIIAGAVKGTIGVGMATVAFPMLASIIDVRAAVMLLAVPVILSNIPQALEGGGTLACLGSLLPILCGMVPGILVGSAILMYVGATVAVTVAGAAVIAAAALMLAAPTLRIRDEVRLPAGIGAGFFGGVLGGVAAMLGPPVFTYLLARGSSGRLFTKKASLFLVLSAALMTLMLAISQRFDWADVGLSTLALAPVGLGMIAGQKLRDALPVHSFKKIVLGVVLIAGVQLVCRGLVA